MGAAWLRRLQLGIRDLAPDGGSSGNVPGWTRRGHPELWGYAWYRIQLRIATESVQTLAMTGPLDIDDAYQAFADGHLIGSFGDFSHSTPTVYQTQPMMFPLPPQQRASLVLALRVWMRPRTPATRPDAGGLHTPPFLGAASGVINIYRLNHFELVRANAVAAFQFVLFLCLAVMCFSLTLFDRTDHAYLWMGTVFLVGSLANGLSFIYTTTQWIGSLTYALLFDLVFLPAFLAVWVMVWWSWFRFKRPALLPNVVVFLTVACMLSGALGDSVFTGFVPGFFRTAGYASSAIVTLAFVALVVFILIRAVRQQGVEGWLVLPAILLQSVSLFPDAFTFFHLPIAWKLLGISIDVVSIANLLSTATLALLLLRRLLHSVREQRRLALDVKQAQEVQQVILPEARTTLPGLVVEREYRPALEVGGDFFQIIPNPPDGSLLIVAGDVTGKGLKAGMLVALLVGAIRSTVESTTDPRAILDALNRRLLGRGDAHATCLALRIEADGACALANAGHMPPYLNGHPLAIDGSLPLGMISATDVSSVLFNLGEGDRLVVISDGIVEATDQNHQLFGFERTEQLLHSASSAADIASAAQSFGQEDDISVISVTRIPALEPAAA